MSGAVAAFNVLENEICGMDKWFGSVYAVAAKAAMLATIERYFMLNIRV